MANPNRVFANMAKNPFDLVRAFRSEKDAEACAQECRDDGFDVKVTVRRKNGRRVHGRWSPPSCEFVVWKRVKP